MLQDWATAKPNVLVAPFLSNDPLWSLAYEWWFYMMFFPLATIIKQTHWRDTLVFGTAICAAMAYIAYPLFVLRILMYMGIWWAGVVVARRYLENAELSLRSLLFPVVSLGMIALALVLDVVLEHSQGAFITLGLHPLLELRHFLFALAALMGAFVWRALNWRFFDVLVKPFGFFAPISYAMYIGHYHIFTDASFLHFIDNSVFRWFAYFAVLLVVSYLVERIMYPVVRNIAINRGARK